MNWDLFGGGNPRDAAPAQRQRAAAPAGEKARPLTVAGLTALAKGLLESAYPPLWVGGEITGWKRHTQSGHCYFCLRDKRSQVRCVMFRADAERLPTEPTEGMSVRALGTLTLFEKRGEFQFVVKLLEGVGAGGLWRLAFEKLRAKLDAEGLLSPDRKRPLPRFPATVGVVTSPFGAALHDVLTVIARRAPWTRVVFAPVRVQGEGAALDVARAIRLFERARVADVLIVGRGGGAAEDLWAFNDEVVARAIASSRIPVVSAIGHEVDVTIADLVADARAPTPSAAAERVVPDQVALARELRNAQLRLAQALRRRVRVARNDLNVLGRDLESLMRSRLRDQRERLAHAAVKLDVLSPLAALRRGYAVPLDHDGHVLRSSEDFAAGRAFDLRVIDGTVQCQALDVQRSEP
jgi:exodeoxyribonuclease VII large subunit